MKKVFFLAFAMGLSLVSFAQSREQVEKKLKTAIENSENPKKAAKYATWFSLGEAYANAYRNPSKDIWPGMPAGQVKVILGKQRVLSSEQREVQGVPFFVDVYEDKELYYNQGGILEIIVVTKPVVEGDALQAAYDAYAKAAELDQIQNLIRIVVGINVEVDQRNQDRLIAGIFLETFVQQNFCFFNLVLRWGGINHSRIQNVAFRVYNSNFATCSIRGVKP